MAMALVMVVMRVKMMMAVMMVMMALHVILILAPMLWSREAPRGTRGLATDSHGPGARNLTPWRTRPSRQGLL